MQNIHIHRYEDTFWVQDAGSIGYIEPDDHSWIIFLEESGNMAIWLNREESGACKGNAIYCKGDKIEIQEPCQRQPIYTMDLI